MATFAITVTVTEDGVTLPGYPITKSKVVTETKGRQQFSRPNAASTYTDLPLGELGDVNVLVVTADQATSVRLNDQSNGSIPLNSGGLLILFDAAIPSGATSKASLENASGSAATVTMVAGGG